MRYGLILALWILLRASMTAALLVMGIISGMWLPAVVALLLVAETLYDILKLRRTR